MNKKKEAYNAYADDLLFYFLFVYSFYNAADSHTEHLCSHHKHNSLQNLHFVS